jgi:hypothetical protein
MLNKPEIADNKLLYSLENDRGLKHNASFQTIAENARADFERIKAVIKKLEEDVDRHYKEVKFFSYILSISINFETVEKCTSCR